MYLKAGSEAHFFYCFRVCMLSCGFEFFVYQKFFQLTFVQ
jgi:hypothetical protein